MLTETIVELSDDNISQSGCFCLRSNVNAPGYINKHNWLHQRFQEGLKYVKIMEGHKEAGFIEYIPIEYSSRVVFGENYMVIHCLWVSMTNKGYASKLINRCLQDAKEQEKVGVIVITNPDTSWVPNKEIFLKHHFKEIAHAPYGFELLVNKFGNAPDPYFPNDWQERLSSFQALTIFRTPQCPFVDIATDNVVEGANKLGIQANIIDLQNREEVLTYSPTPYGIYGVVYKGTLLSFHRLTVHSAIKRLKALHTINCCNNSER
ncbi:GNAT family N-acetyltransferase [Lysinibacillus sp. NPDC097195]|uniref:GNAT family N-acetyltransferase n=1 Tax=Lysinibacillus sp. NPDC097195 TaxID=3364141 RepID=UPI00382C22B5